MICTIGEVEIKPDQYLDEVDIEHKLKPYYIVVDENGELRRSNGFPEDEFPVVAPQGGTIRQDDYIFLSAIHRDVIDDSEETFESSIRHNTSRLKELGVEVLSADNCPGKKYLMPIDIRLNTNGDVYFFVEPGDGIPFNASFAKKSSISAKSVAELIANSCNELLHESGIIDYHPVQIEVRFNYMVAVSRDSEDFPYGLEPNEILNELKTIKGQISFAE